MISDYLKLAIKNLRQRKLRSWLTMLGIFISIATIFTLISLSLGLQGAVKEQFRILGADKFFVQPSTGFLGHPGSVGGVILTEKDVEILSKVRGVKDYSYYVIANAKIQDGKEIKYVMIAGLPLNHVSVYEEISTFKAEQGRLLKEGDREEIVIGNLFSTGEIFDKKINAGDKIKINGKDFKVKGILETLGNPQDDSLILMGLEDFRELFDIPERIDFVMIQINEGENILDVANNAEEKLRKFRGETEKTQKFSILTPEDLLSSFQDILLIITAFLASIAMISLIVGGVGIANTMYTSVVERTKEIGTMKAVGAQNKDILYIFLIESGLLGLVGAIIGVILGFGFSKTIEYFVKNIYDTNLLQVATPIYLVLGCLVFGFLIGTISGVFPAWRASKINVVDALRYE